MADRWPLGGPAEDVSYTTEYRATPTRSGLERAGRNVRRWLPLGLRRWHEPGNSSEPGLRALCASIGVTPEVISGQVHTSLVRMGERFSLLDVYKRFSRSVAFITRC